MDRFKILFFNSCCFLAVQVYGSKTLVPGRIVGGFPTTIEEHPYQLSLRHYGSHICGASIIGSKFALTAAHCIDGYSASRLTVRAGSSYRGFGGRVHKVSVICQHPLYNSVFIDYDVSVLTLIGQLRFSNSVKPIPLQQIGQEILVGTIAVVSGWGTLSESGSASQVLQEVSLPRVTDDTCKDAYGSSAITERMFCFGYTGGERGFCQGDLGGALNHNGVQIGIASWSIGCARPNYPGVYTKISNSAIFNHIEYCRSNNYFHSDS